MPRAAQAMVVGAGAPKRFGFWTLSNILHYTVSANTW